MRRSDKTPDPCLTATVRGQPFQGEAKEMDYRLYFKARWQTKAIMRKYRLMAARGTWR